MRDFLPESMLERQYVFDTIREVFENYGYQPFESPAIENWEILSNKGGEEVAKQIYKFKDKGDRDVGLRFDLTIPITRVVASNPVLQKPFRRYSIGRVWRYERPQTGRFREFWQADVDIFGVKETSAEVELLSVAIKALSNLGFSNFKIRLNNRKILTEIISYLGVPSILLVPKKTKIS